VFDRHKRQYSATRTLLRIVLAHYMK
jgi:hypothetical protein